MGELLIDDSTFEKIDWGKIQRPHDFNDRFSKEKKMSEHKRLILIFFTTRPEVIKHFSCSTQLRMKFILLINVQMPTFVCILTFISRINSWLL